LKNIKDAEKTSEQLKPDPQSKREAKIEQAITGCVAPQCKLVGAKSH
jgi:hypothetical protein